MSTEPHPSDVTAIENIAQRTDVTATDPIGCRTRHHAGRCVIETLSDGTTRHRETFSPADARIWNDGRIENVHVMTSQGFRLTRDGRRLSDPASDDARLSQLAHHRQSGGIGPCD